MNVNLSGRVPRVIQSMNVNNIVIVLAIEYAGPRGPNEIARLRQN
jgi:hypothetical protein